MVNGLVWFQELVSKRHEVDNPSSNTFFFIGTFVFEWYVVLHGSKNVYQKDMCLKEIGLHIQNIMTIMSLKANITKGTYMTI
jgi:hypothetical protein